MLRPAKRLWWWAEWHARSGFAAERRLFKRHLALLQARTASAVGRVLDAPTRERAITTITTHIEQTYTPRPWNGSIIVAQSATLFPDDGMGWREIEGMSVETHLSATWADDQQLILAEPAVVWLADLVRGAVDRVRKSA
jgi:hypothetical protein